MILAITAEQHHLFRWLGGLQTSAGMAFRAYAAMTMCAAAFVSLGVFASLSPRPCRHQTLDPITSHEDQRCRVDGALDVQRGRGEGITNYLPHGPKRRKLG
ncbi:unnamed protein product [Diplocarpon coronariae]